MCQCSLNSDGLSANDFIANVFQLCVYTPKEMVSFVSGWLCLLSFMCGHIPYIYIATALRSSDGLSPQSIGLWLTGDTLYLISSIITKQLLTMKLLALYYTIIDSIFLVQYLAFGKPCSRCRARRRAASPAASAAEPPRMTLRASLRNASMAVINRTTLRASYNINPRATEILKRRASVMRNVRATAREETAATVKNVPTRRTLGSQQLKNSLQIFADNSEESAGAAQPDRRAALFTTSDIVRLGGYVVPILGCVVLALLLVDAHARLEPEACETQEIAHGLYVTGVAMGWVTSFMSNAAGAVVAFRIHAEKNGWNKIPVLFAGAGLGCVFNAISMFTAEITRDILVSRLSFMINAVFAGSCYWLDFIFTLYYRRHPGGRALNKIAAVEPAALAGTDASSGATSVTQESIPSLDDALELEGGSALYTPERDELQPQ
eukprot:gnl/Chilomastix_cuspidata/3911.p1 GENE.gnl/Chilomastix_cuspidata/3911~~gnl/Chilomastix_cuspidata/3911.p1  ORF type:complete len:436 (+),score=178.00 gnl/Chilomastix_cuspidata/3911:89-1396(+)